MTPEQENFDALRRLLKVKRHEQPPPGYFNDFSQQVIAQIRAAAPVERDSVLDRLSWEVPWLQRLIDAFQAKPALAVSFGAAVCTLLVGSVIYSESLEFKPVAVPIVAGTPDPVTQPPIASVAFPLAGSGEAALAASGTNNSMNPIAQPVGSLFDQFSIKPQPVSYQLQGNGK
jgi:hypothetical protein